MNIMVIGDICGRPGRQAAAHYIPKLKTEYNINCIIANGENAAGGVGITLPVYEELMSMGIDIVTTGNHVWDKKEIFDFIDKAEFLLRPANYPLGTPGKGYTIIPVGPYNIGIVNLAGRVFMPPVDCPFRTADEIISKLETQCDFVVVDFHAEATSEKMALGWFLDGRISCLVGTHTHIQTADERIFPKGTAYISDLGMVGPYHSILGVDKEPVIRKFLTGLPVKFSVATGESIFCAIIVVIDDHSGKAVSVTRIQNHFV